MTGPIDFTAARQRRRRASAEIDAWIAGSLPEPAVCPRIMGRANPGYSPPSPNAVRERRKIWLVLAVLVGLCGVAMLIGL